MVKGMFFHLIYQSSFWGVAHSRSECTVVCGLWWGISPSPCHTIMVFFYFFYHQYISLLMVRCSFLRCGGKTDKLFCKFCVAPAAKLANVLGCVRWGICTKAVFPFLVFITIVLKYVKGH